MPHIYKITSPKNKVYIGSTVNINERFNSYKRLDCKAQHKIFNSLKKYGVENHKFEIIIECNIEDMYRLECYYGNLFNTLTDAGLNCRLPNEDTNFSCISSETKNKISLKNKSRVWTDESRNKLSTSMTGKKYSDEVNKSKGRKGRVGNMTGKKHSEESRIKMSESRKGHKYNLGKKRTDEQKLEMSKRRIGEKHSEETKYKISQSNKGKKRTEEQRLHLSKLKKNAPPTSCKKVINIKTLQVYKSAKEVSNILNISYYNFVSKMNGKLKNNTDYKYV